MKRPQVWVQLEPADKELLDQLADRTKTSASALAGMWVRRGLAGAYHDPEGLAPEEKVLMDRLTDLAAKLSPRSAARVLLESQDGSRYREALAYAAGPPAEQTTDPDMRVVQEYAAEAGA